MTNFSIDGSVYAYQLHDNALNVDDLYNYCKIIRDLHDLIIEKQPRTKKYFLFKRDIISIIKNDELNLINKDISLFKNIIRDNPEKQFLVIEAQKLLYEIWDRLITVTPEGYENNDNEYNEKDKKSNLNKKILFENWFDIENISFASTNDPKLPNDIIKEIQNKELRKNLKKNLTIIATLNKYIYKNNESHKIVFSNNSTLNILPITARFDIEMKKVTYQNKNGETKSFVHRIKNIPLKNVSINEQNVNISTIELLMHEKIHYNNWEDAYNNAQNDFKNCLTFGNECKIGIEQYINKIKNERGHCKEDEIKMIDKWLNEFPDTLYENLKALNNFIEQIDLKINNPVNSGERYHCRNTCDLYDFCSSYIRFFGVDCVDETVYHKGVPNQKGECLEKLEIEKIKKDRTKENSKGEKSIYWLHLRPQTISYDSSLSFLTLRIYFKRFDLKKIEIGWIGRHLYLPPRTP
jgi:hypothetical protein